MPPERDRHYKNYLASGGLLDLRYYRFAQAFLTISSELHPNSLSYHSLRQAEVMARTSGINLTTQQQYLYAHLRPLILDGRESLEGTPTSLSDQPLLAQVLLITNGEGDQYFKFTRCFHHIFGPSEA